jgi:hypothetical protein
MVGCSWGCHLVQSSDAVGPGFVSDVAGSRFVPDDSVEPVADGALEPVPDDPVRFHPSS